MKKIFLTLTMLRISLVLVFVFSFIACDKTMPGNDEDLGPYNIDVTLKGSDFKNPNFSATGFIKFRQDPDTNRIITLDTWIFNLQHDHDYILQRAVNPITDADCTSTAWLTLGKGLVSQAIHTDAKGNGYEELFRDITSIARGTTFRIHFQVLDAVTLETVLTSDCEQYTVR